MNCDESQNLISDYLLGETSPTQSEALLAHINAGCADCANMMSEMEETLAALTTTAVPVTPPNHLEDRLMARVENDPQETRTSFLREHDWVITVISALAASFVTAVVTWQSFSATHSQNAGEASKLQRAVAARKDQIGALRRELASEVGFAEIFRSTELYAVTFTPVGDDLDQTASARAVFDARSRRLGIALRGLPTIEVGRTFRVWLTDNKPIPLTNFTTTAQGDAAVVVKLPDNVSIETLRLAISNDRLTSKTPDRSLLTTAPNNAVKLATFEWQSATLIASSLWP